MAGIMQMQLQAIQEPNEVRKILDERLKGDIVSITR